MNKSYSYSELSAAYRCNQYYKYLYVDKLKSKEPDSGDMKFGTGIHLAIEAILSQNYPSPGFTDTDYISLFNLFWDLEKEHNNRYGRYKWEELREQGHTLLARFERLHKKKFIPFRMEERLYGSIGDIKVEGTPDFLGTYEGKASVVDFKTAGYRYHKDKIMVSEQMLLYSYLARQSLRFMPEQIVYVIFVKGINPSIQCLSYPITETLIDIAIKNVALQASELDDKIKAGQITRNYANCIQGENKCPFFDKCHGRRE